MSRLGPEDLQQTTKAGNEHGFKGLPHCPAPIDKSKTHAGCHLAFVHRCVYFLEQSVACPAAVWGSWERKHFTNEFPAHCVSLKFFAALFCIQCKWVRELTNPHACLWVKRLCFKTQCLLNFSMITSSEAVCALLEFGCGFISAPASLLLMHTERVKTLGSCAISKSIHFIRINLSMGEEGREREMRKKTKVVMLAFSTLGCSMALLKTKTHLVSSWRLGFLLTHVD